MSKENQQNEKTEENIIINEEVINEEVPNLEFEEEVEEVPNLDFEEDVKSDNWNYKQYPELMSKQELFDLICLVNKLSTSVQAIKWLSFCDNEMIALKESVSANYDFIIKRPTLHKLIRSNSDVAILFVANLPVFVILAGKIKKRFSVGGIFKGMFKKKVAK